MPKSKDDPIVGHKTLIDGTHAPLRKSEADALWEACERAKRDREKRMPTTDDALSLLGDVRQRFRELGWKESHYCPKDGTEFAVIQFGSTGIFRSHYLGDWPSGSLMICDHFHHPDGCLFKPLEDLTEAETEKLARCEEMDRQMVEAALSAFAQQEDET